MKNLIILSRTAVFFYPLSNGIFRHSRLCRAIREPERSQVSQNDL